MPQRRRMGFAEIGLPYAADAAITRHMARFLRQQAAQSEHGSVRRGPSGLAAPTHVLFNGGVLRRELVRERILGRSERLAQAGRPRSCLAAGRRRPDACRGARSSLLRTRANWPRRAHPRRRPTDLLRRHRKLHARCARHARSTESAHRGSVRHGRRHGGASCASANSAWRSANRPNSASSNRQLAKTTPAGSMLEEISDDLEELSPVKVTLPADGNAGNSFP